MIIIQKTGIENLTNATKYKLSLQQVGTIEQAFLKLEKKSLSITWYINYRFVLDFQ